MPIERSRDFKEQGMAHARRIRPDLNKDLQIVNHAKQRQRLAKTNRIHKTSYREMLFRSALSGNWHHHPKEHDALRGGELC